MVATTQSMSVFTFDTEWPADTVEFAPGHDDLLVLGTYLLHEATETSPMSRSGKLSLLQLVDGPRIVQSFEMGAITDSKWSV
jgi:diphthamide biosynthesis protein 7